MSDLGVFAANGDAFWKPFPPPNPLPPEPIRCSSREQGNILSCETDAFWLLSAAQDCSTQSGGGGLGQHVEMLVFGAPCDSGMPSPTGHKLFSSIRYYCCTGSTVKAPITGPAGP